MPSGLAAAVRQQLATMDTAGLVLQKSPYSKTGFTNVIKVNGKYQARLQVKGDGPGGVRKRKQYSLPGLFDTALEAAQYLAMIKRDGVASLCDENGIPMKQDKQHKARSKQPMQPAATQPPQQPCEVAVATAMAWPVACYMPHMPLVPVSPVPMQPLGYTPPFA